MLNVGKIEEDREYTTASARLSTELRKDREWWCSEATSRSSLHTLSAYTDSDAFCCRAKEG